MKTLHSTNEGRPDKRRTPKTHHANFKLREPGFVPPFEQVTSVSVIPFTESGLIVATEDKRGKDLPGGHVTCGEISCEETARRESLEEAGITMRNLSFLRTIESDLYGSAPGELTYMVILTGIVEDIVAEPMEGKRHLMTVERFKEEHKSLNSSMLHELVDEAHAAIFG